MSISPTTVIRQDVGTLKPTPRKPVGSLLLKSDLKTPSGKPAGPLVAATFSATGDELVTLDSHGQLVSFYLYNNRYAAIRRNGAKAIAIAFSPLRRAELYVALVDGTIECVDTATRAVTGVLKGHIHAARSLVCHPRQALLLSCASNAAILWNTTATSWKSDFKRVRSMPAEPARTLQHALFLPSGDGLLTCAERGLEVFNLSFASVGSLKLPPSHDASLRLRSCAVTPDSSVAAGAGDGGWLAVWSLSTCTLARMVLLPDAFGGVSQLLPLPPGPTSGSAPLLLTCADGALRVVDAAAPAVIQSVAPSGGQRLVSATPDPSLRHIAAVVADGTVAVYGYKVLMPRKDGAGVEPLRSATAGPLFDDEPPDEYNSKKPGIASGKPAPRPVPPLPFQSEFGRTMVDANGSKRAAELPLARLGGLSADSALLDTRRMAALLRTCWVFPARQRPYAWRLALQLPGNARAHAALLAKGPHAACARLNSSLPLADRRGLGRLERLLSCLSHWCPLLAQVGELPPMVFPWLLAFDGDDKSAFEAAATILLNWGQGFYEFHPNPPVEVLRDADAILSQRNPSLRSHLLAIGSGAQVWGWPLLASLFARVLSRSDWLQLWDHLLCAEPVFILYVLAAFVHLHAPILLEASSATEVANILLRPSALQMRAWLSSAYEQYDNTPASEMPKWSPFQPLPPGEVYPPGLPHPTVLIDYGAQQIEAIRRSEVELARQRTLAAAMDEATENESARLNLWSEREAALDSAEEEGRKQLAARKAQLDKQSAETALALKEQRLKSASIRSARMKLTQESREREHLSTMQSLREQLDQVEQAAGMQLSARAEEFRLLSTEAHAQERVLDAQESAAEAAHRKAVELAVQRRAAELEALEKEDAHNAAARLEAAAMRRMAESERRSRSLAAHSEQARQAAIDAEMQQAELRRTMRSAELQRQAELEAIRQEEADLARAAHETELLRSRSLAAQDEEAAEALLAEQRAWIARRQSERAAIVEHERRGAATRLDKQTADINTMDRIQRRKEVERRVSSASHTHLAAEMEHESQLASSLQALQAAATAAPGLPESAAYSREEWAKAAAEHREAMAKVDQVALSHREALLSTGSISGRVLAGLPTAGTRSEPAPPPPPSDKTTEELQAALLSEALAAGQPGSKRVSLPPEAVTVSKPAAAAKARSPALPPRPAARTMPEESGDAPTGGVASATPTPSASELRTLELLGLEPNLLSELRAHSTGGSEGGEGKGRPSSLSSGGMAEEALGGIRLSGLDPELAAKLKEAAKAGRDSGMGGSVRLSSASEGSAADADVQKWLEKEAAARMGGAGGGGGDESCAACDALREQYAEHDEWVATLKDSAEEVLATHQQTREALARMMPGGSPAEETPVE